MSQLQIEQSLHNTMQALSLSEDAKVVIGLSGGLDSVVLLHALVSSQLIRHSQILCVHVNHQLHKESTSWSHFCLEFSKSLNIQCITETVNVHTLKQQRPKESLEALAREARYSVFKRHLLESAVLLTAHHANDQVETFFLQLMRSAGSKGLQSMPLIKPFFQAQHVRPFLALNRSTLEGYAKAHQLDYLDDPSNLDVKFDRNYLRHQVLQGISQRWPHYQDSVLRSIANLQAERSIMLELLERQYPNFYAKQALHIKHLQQLDKNKQIILMRIWIEQYNQVAPPRQRLQEFLRQLNELEIDSQAELRWNNCVLTLFQNRLYFRRLWTEEQKKHWDELQKITFSTSIDLGSNFIKDMGTIECVMPNYSCEFVLRFRQGGESLRLNYNNFQTKLKKLLNQKAIFPWWRSRIPLIYHGETLVAVADLWINAEWLEQQKISDFKVFWHNRPAILFEKSSH